MSDNPPSTISPVHVVSVINKTPYTSDPESIYLCPKTFLFPAAPVRLSDKDEKPMDNGKLREFIALANKIRKEQIIDATSNYCHSDMTRNKRNVKEDEPKINDIAYIQGLSERMAFLKFLVLGTESTIGAQICWIISIKDKHF